MNASEILNKAESHMNARASTYDASEGERSMHKAVAAFNAITGGCMTEAEGWLLMLILKNVRLFTNLNTVHIDSVEDSVAYAALLGECATQQGLTKPARV